MDVVSARLVLRLRALLRTALLTTVCVAARAAASAPDSLETVEVVSSREVVRRQIFDFVSQVTRREGDLVGRWTDAICPLVVGVSDPQTEFMRERLIDVYAEVRNRPKKDAAQCRPNLFIIITDDPDAMLAGWKDRDPGMFRWKSRSGVSRSSGVTAVRTWHNAIEAPSDDSPLNVSDHKPPQGKLKDSRIQSSAAEHIEAVVVLVDSRSTRGVTVAQLADYVAIVSLAQVDASADLGETSSILQLFREPRPATLPAGLTEFDHAFLNALYRASYTAERQRRDIMSNMKRALVPRGK
jgi:hypothetical protein